MEALKKFLAKIEALMNELQLAVNNANAISATNKNKEQELADLILQTKALAELNESKSADLVAREKKVVQLADYATASKTLDEAQKEHRRMMALLEEKQKAHDKKVKDETAEVERKKIKLNTEREAFENEKKDWKEKMSKKIIDDYVKEKLRS